MRRTEAEGSGRHHDQGPFFTLKTVIYLIDFPLLFLGVYTLNFLSFGNGFIILDHILTGTVDTTSKLMLCVDPVI